MGFIRVILIIVIVYYLWTLISRFILIPLLQGYFKKATNNGKTGYNKSKNAGDTFINTNIHRKKYISKDRGEYIDFEEINE